MTIIRDCEPGHSTRGFMLPISPGNNLKQLNITFAFSVLHHAGVSRTLWWTSTPKAVRDEDKKYHPIAEIILVRSQTCLCILCFLISTHFRNSNPECQPIGYFHPSGVFFLCQSIRFCQHASAFMSLTLMNTWQQFSHRTDPCRAPIGTCLQTKSPSFSLSCSSSSSWTGSSPTL